MRKTQTSSWNYLHFLTYTKKPFTLGAMLSRFALVLMLFIQQNADKIVVVRGRSRRVHFVSLPINVAKVFYKFPLSINKKRQCDLSHFPINLFPLLIDALINDKDLHFTHLISRICFLHLLVLLNPASIHSILVSTTRQTHQSRSQHTLITISQWAVLRMGFLSLVSYPFILL